MNKCPYCQGQMADSFLPPPMRARYRLIYDTVVSAGQDGIRGHDLVRLLPRGKNPTTMRVAIHYTNQALKAVGQRIVCRRDLDNQGRYYLTGESLCLTQQST